jgi:hypothetical protein
VGEGEYRTQEYPVPPILMGERVKGELLYFPLSIYRI